MQRTLYIIATTSRSGSTYLCDLLTSTGRLGEPEEYYNRRSKPQRMRAWNATSDIEYFQQLLLRTSSPGGVCGMKVSTDALDDFRSGLGPLFELLRPNYIWLRRRDVLRQAISLYRATETDIWRWREGEAKPNVCPPFDADKIAACRKQIEQANATWASWFGEHKLDPLELWYEDVVAAPREAVESICRHAGVDVNHLPQMQSDLQVMRDAITEDWIRSCATS